MNIEDIKKGLSFLVGDDKLEQWSSCGSESVFGDSSKDDLHSSHNIKTFIECSKDKPFSMVCMDRDEGIIDALVLITKPFTSYRCDEYGSIEFIEFENDDKFYGVSFNTPMEQMSYNIDHNPDFHMDWEASSEVREFFAEVQKVVNEIVV